MNDLVQLNSAVITGATGFIGSRLALTLAANGCTVHAIVRPESELTQLSPPSDRVKIHRWNGTPAHMTEILQESRPNVVFHLASLFLAAHKPEDIPRLIDSNLSFGAVLLEAMVQMTAGTKVELPIFINTGTSWEHFKDASYRPVNLYAATKQAFESLIAYYCDAHALRAITLKLFDTYGPGDPRPKLLSLLVRAAHEKKSLEMSPGEQLLDLVYIDDVISAFVLAAEYGMQIFPAMHKHYAISSGERLSLRQLVAMIGKTLGIEVPVHFGGRPYRDREVMIPWSNGLALPGWHPHISLAEGLKRTFQTH